LTHFNKTGRQNRAFSVVFLQVLARLCTFLQTFTRFCPVLDGKKRPKTDTIKNIPFVFNMRSRTEAWEIGHQILG